MITAKTADIYNFRHLFFLDKFLIGHEGFIDQAQAAKDKHDKRALHDHELSLKVRAM